ncbi:MAG: TonB-dependent receptor [Massilia sp.]
MNVSLLPNEKAGVLAVRAAVLAITTVLAHAQAQAQQTTTAPQMQRVEITGSSIKRTEAEGVAALQVLTRADIEQSGKTTISDVLRTLSADGNGSISAGFNGFAAGASGVSLRGLGVNSTLVLINGRRTANYGFGDDGAKNFVDLNSIPFDAVERIEVLKDGASAIYGSDAMAGVVNIILRRNYTGKTFSATGGKSGRGDGAQTGASATMGFGDLAEDKYNILVNLTAKKQSAIWQRDRDDYIGQADARPWGGRDQRSGGTALGGGGGNSLLGNVRPVDAAGNVIPGMPVQNLAGVCPPAMLDPTGNNNSAGGCLYDPVQFRQIQPDSQNVNLFTRGVFNLGETLTAYTEIGYFNSDVKTVGTPAGPTGTRFNLATQQVYNTGSGPDQLLLPIGHPDNPFPNYRARPRWAGEQMPSRNEYDTDTVRVLAGLKGSAGAWDLDSGVLFTQSTTHKTQRGAYSQSALKAAIDAGTFRIGTNFGLNSPEVLAKVIPVLENTAKTRNVSADFKATRELMALPGGALALAAGAEVRHESLDGEPTPGTYTGDINGSYAAARGARTVVAAYAELAAPILKTLELQLAGRADHYSDYGKSVTPKVGFKYTPLAALALRGSYSEGFRAPSAAESGDSATSGATTRPKDPVRCPVTNLPADCSSTTIGVMSVGNKDLRPETSQNFTLGMVVEPVKNVSLSLDLWRLVRRNEIVGVSPTAVLANPQAYPNASITRGESTTDFPNLPGPILLVKAPFQNSGRTSVDGLDLDLRSHFNVAGVGRVRAGVTATYTHSFKRRNGDGSIQEFAGTHGDTDLSGNGGTPKLRTNWVLGWDRGPWSVTGTVNYVSGMSDKNDTTSDCLDTSAAGVPYLDCHIDSFTTVDLGVKWKATRQWELLLSVSNLFDKMAPLDVQTYGQINYNPNYHQSGAIGRYMALTARYTF